MSRNNQEGYSYNPVNPSYTFNGNNTNYNFVLPGAYDLKLDMPGSGNQRPNPKNTFHSVNEMNTNVVLPNSVVSNLPASPASVQVIGNQPRSTNIPQSPMQRGFCATPPPRPPGSPFVSNSPFAGSVEYKCSQFLSMQVLKSSKYVEAKLKMAQGNSPGNGSQSPIQRGYSSTGAMAPQGSSFLSSTFLGTPPPNPRMMSFQNVQPARMPNPIKKEDSGFTSPAPVSRSPFRNLSAEDIHPRTPRPSSK